MRREPGIDPSREDENSGRRSGDGDQESSSPRPVELSREEVESILRDYTERLEREYAWHASDDDYNRKQLREHQLDSMAEWLLALSHYLDIDDRGPYEHASDKQQFELDVRIGVRRKELVKRLIRHWRENGLL